MHLCGQMDNLQSILTPGLLKLYQLLLFLYAMSSWNPAVCILDMLPVVNQADCCELFEKSPRGWHPADCVIREVNLARHSCVTKLTT